MDLADDKTQGFTSDTARPEHLAAATCVSFDYARERKQAATDKAMDVSEEVTPNQRLHISSQDSRVDSSKALLGRIQSIREDLSHMSALHNQMRDQSQLELSRINAQADVTADHINDRTRPVTDLDRTARSNIFSTRMPGS